MSNGAMMKRMNKRDSIRRRMIIDRRARKYCDMIVKYYMDGIMDTLRDKISALIAKVASSVKNPKFKKALLKISGAVAAGKMQKASVGLKKAAAAVKNNPAIVGGAAAAAAVGAGLTAAWKLSDKFVGMLKKGAMNLSEAGSQAKEKLGAIGGKAKDLVRNGVLAAKIGLAKPKE